MCNFGVFFRRFVFLFLISICFCIGTCASFPEISASSAILINSDTGEVIYSKNVDTKRGMASTTKIMTAILAIENGVLDEMVEISDDAIGVEGSSLYLKKDEAMTLRDLLYGLMLRSANDAAEAIAIHISGSVEDFATLMNDKAASLSLANTHFTNPHGLSDDNHYTTAYDLAILTSYAMKNNTFREICSTKKATISGNRTVVNHNKLLFLLDGICGVKTGFTKDTGRCLVSAADRNGVEFVSVTLNAPDDWNDHTKMIEYGFNEYEAVPLLSKGDCVYKLPVVGGDYESVSLVAEKDVTVCLKKKRGSIVESLKFIRPRFAPIYKEETLGYAVYTLDGTVIASVPLVAEEYIGKR
ncbi:MAG: D-alanyl-D-alanine carboxypeptidase [Clostridia bacterium]|nr:D-alanyl-D-alanine carboxypeptidase [Clostridia bacterium]